MPEIQKNRDPSFWRKTVCDSVREWTESFWELTAQVIFASLGVYFPGNIDTKFDL